MKNKLVVMRVYERDAKRLRAKYPQFKSDAMRLEELLKPEIWFSNKVPDAKLEITPNANPFYGGDSPLSVPEAGKGEMGITMPKVILEVKK